MNLQLQMLAHLKDALLMQASFWACDAPLRVSLSPSVNHRDLAAMNVNKERKRKVKIGCGIT